jgi:hypothetical protein
MPAWEAHDPTLSRPIAASLERCAELLGIDLDAIQEAAAHLDPYLRVDGTKVCLMQQRGGRNLARATPTANGAKKSSSQPSWLDHQRDQLLSSP